MSEVAKWVFGSIVLMLGTGYGHDAVGQVAAPPPFQQPTMPGAQKERSAEDAMTPEQRREFAKKQNEARQQELKKDTDKLLELATELKQYVDKTNENLLSMNVVKKAEQIEKLAHSVKEKMKGQ